jgi:hypothetical protein
MFISGTRTIMLGFLTLLAIGSFGASAAYGEAGPFFHHRAIGGKGEGEKIEQPADEQFQGEGGQQILDGELAGTKIEMVANSVQAKGIFYNNVLQGQFKLLQKYHEPKLVKPELKGCEVKLGTNNELTLFGHLAWKWQGTREELTEQPQKNQKPSGIGLPGEIETGATALPKGTITDITLSGAGCGVLAGKFEIKESISALAKPANLGEWSTTVVVTFSGWKELHFWNGKENIGVTQGLTFGGNPASYTGSSTVKAAAQEVAVFEK